MKNKLYVMIALFCTGLSGMLQARVYPIKVVNNSGAKLFISTQYRKKNHNSDQYRQLQLDIGATGNVEYEDSFRQIFMGPIAGSNKFKSSTIKSNGNACANGLIPTFTIPNDPNASITVTATCTAQ